MDWKWILPLYLVGINLIAVGLTIHDKRMARKGKWRTPEATLLAVSALGGSVGMYLTMKKIRHKTKKNKFMLGIPVIFILQVLLCAGILYLSCRYWG